MKLLKPNFLDPGVKFTHPNKDVISLQDIFVYPTIRQLHLPGQPEWVKTVVQASLIDFVKNNRHILLIGGEKSGKSGLAKTLFRDLLKSDFIPLIISGSQVKNFDNNYLESTIKKRFEEAYSSPEFSKFQQLVSDKKILIIDDYHKCSLNTKGRDQLVRNMEKEFGYIILLGNDQLRFNDLVAMKSDHDLSFWDFTTCEIMEFGKLKRKELIEKWYSLGSAYSVDDTVLKQELDSCREADFITDWQQFCSLISPVYSGYASTTRGPKSG